MSSIKWQGKSGRSIRHWMEWFLVGEPFWGLWGGRVFNTLIMSALVAYCLQVFDNRVKQFVDTTVQSTLLNQMATDDYFPPACDLGSNKGLASCITVVGVDDQDFRGTFKQQSPLDPSQLQALFDKMRQYPPKAVAVDLDFAPASEADMDTRDKLRTSLLEVSRLTHLIMVCPQGYSTPEPGELDQQWVRSFRGSAQFALADLDADGLYYRAVKTERGEATGEYPWQMQSLGVATAEALRGGKEPIQAGAYAKPRNTATPQGVEWDNACRAAGSVATKKSEQTEKRLIRPAPVNAINFAQAIATPQVLQGRVVVLGGKWGVNDKFILRGQPDPIFGVNLHAWVLASELAPPPQVPQALEQLIDVTVGLLFGLLFQFLWRRIDDHHHHYACRSFFYVCFFAVAIAVPLTLILGAVHLAKIGLSLSVAGMVLSSAADSFISSHEPHGGPHKARTIDSGIAVPMWLGLCGAAALASGSAWLAGWHVVSFGFMGVALGLALAWPDTKDRELYQEFVPSKDERVIDLFVRFAWLCIKLALLVRVLASQENTTLVLEFSLMGTWLLAVYLGRQQDRSRPALAS